MIIFYAGISCFHLGAKYKANKKLKVLERGKCSQRYYNLNAIHTTECALRSVLVASLPKSVAIQVMREKVKQSTWNYQNKVHLLEAVMLSATSTGMEVKAKVSFNAAITAARSSKFVHEQGLACELAALYSLQHKENEDASNLFQQALECYTEWGSQIKVDSITQQLNKLGVDVPRRQNFG